VAAAGAALVNTAAAAAQAKSEVPQFGVNDPAEPGCASAVSPAESEENAAIGEDGVRLDLNCSDVAPITTSEEVAKVSASGAIEPPPLEALAAPFRKALKGASEQEIAQLVAVLRGTDLRKPPSIAESIDWARTLIALGADEVTDDVTRQTLSVLLKYERDIDTALAELQIAG